MKSFNLYYVIHNLGIKDNIVIKDVEFRQSQGYTSEAVLRNVKAKTQQEAEINSEHKLTTIINLISYKYEYPISFFLSHIEDENGKILNMYGVVTSEQKMSLNRKAAPKIEELFDLHVNDEPLNKIFSLLNRENPYSWVNMYRIYEVIKSEVDEDTKRKLMSKNQEKRFRVTANHPEHTGSDARHGVLYTDPNKKPMSLNEAINFIKKLIENFIELRSK